MATTLTKEDEKLIGGILGILIGVPLRLAIVTLALMYVMPLWLAYAHSPRHWAWWYGTALGCVPTKYIPRLAILAAIATFFASFFI